MTDSRRERIDHAAHDLDLLAAAADRSVDATTRLAAERQVAECQDCAALFADLRLISAGLSSLPKELRVARDFRLSPERAAKLRPAGWRAVLQGLFGSGPSLRPFASALTTLGIAGLLLTVGLPNLLGGLGGSAASAPERNILSTVGSAVSQAPAPAGAPGTDKSNFGASPEADLGGGTHGPATSPVAVRGPTGTPQDNRYQLGPSQATDGGSLSSGNPEAPAPSFPTLGILAAISLGVLLLGLVLLVRSRGRPFDSIG